MQVVILGEFIFISVTASLLKTFCDSLMEDKLRRFINQRELKYFSYIYFFEPQIIYIAI